MDLKTVRDEFDRIAKTQEQSTTKYHQLIDMVEKEIKEALSDLQSADDTSSIDHKSVIEHLKDKFDAYSLQEQLKMLKEDHEVDLNNYPEILGKVVETDISKASRNVEFDSHIVNQIILNLFYQEGLFEIADIFKIEAQEPDNVSLRSQFSQMHQILDALKAKNVDPALSWVSVNRQKLDQTAGSNLEFDLRRLQFLELIKVNQSEAANFARTTLSSLSSNHRNEFLNLTVCLLWPEKIETLLHSDLISPEQWAAVSHKLMDQFCGSIGLSFRNPLAVTVEAGAQGLPTILNMANLMGREEWAVMRQFPVPMELGKEFQFHSIFVCPVCWEQCDEDNPAIMVYECCHVFCNRTIATLMLMIQNVHKHRFVCPYCPIMTSIHTCRRLYF